MAIQQLHRNEAFILLAAYLQSQIDDMLTHINSSEKLWYAHGAQWILNLMRVSDNEVFTDIYRDCMASIDIHKTRKDMHPQAAELIRHIVTNPQVIKHLQKTL
jgi:hypothetical protein